MDKHKCLRCFHTWLPRIEGRPVSCPSCKSRLWDVPRPEPRVESLEEQNKRELMTHMAMKIPCMDDTCPYCHTS